jgi:hypothetical protein
MFRDSARRVAGKWGGYRVIIFRFLEELRGKKR